MPDQQPQGHAEETFLPAMPDDDVLEGTVVDGPPPPTVAFRAVQVAQVAAIVIRHQHTRSAARNIGYVLLGVTVATRRVWESRTTARYDRMLRSAQQTGDHGAALEWDSRRSAFLAERHARTMARVELALRIVLLLPRLALGLFSVLAVIGVFLAIGERHLAEITAPFLTVAHLVMWAGLAFSVSYGPVLLALPWVAVGSLWWAGRAAAAAGNAPAWARTAADADADIAIDETTVAKSLEALRIPQVRDYLKQGLPLQYLVPCRVDGRGTHFTIRLPAGVPAERIARRRADVATGLYRQAKEVWLTTGEEAGILDGWIADKGALAEGAGPYPLLAEGSADVFKGLPFGKVLRGEPIRIPVIGRNTICGGMPEQGKSSAARVVACGYTLDITTEVRIYVPDTNFDFERFKPRCSRYIMGAEDEHIESILGELEELKDELQRRGQLLVDCEQPEVTAQVAATVPGLHPVFWLLEEAHVAIQHRKYGKDISQLLCENVKLDRKRGVHMMVSTQAPTKDSMPRDVTRNCTNGIAFAVGDHVANDGLLGQGAYRAGHRATDLIPGTDRGTALCKGFSGQRSEIIQVHFVAVKDDNDQVTPLVQRALSALADEGRPIPGTRRGVRPIEHRDLLDDLAAVITGPDKVRVADLPPRLRDLAKQWLPYRSLTGVQLRELLDAEGVRTTNTGNVRELDPADLGSAIANRTAGASELGRGYPPNPFQSAAARRPS